MSKPLKLAVIRAKHDPNAADLADEDVRQMFFANAKNSAVFEFWKEGFVDLSSSVLLGSVSFQIDFAMADSRSDLARHIYDKLIAAGADLTTYSGFVILPWPGGDVSVPNPKAGLPGEQPTITRGIDGGTSNFDDGRKFCVLPIGSSDHTFFCHELGHVIGFEHTYGLLNNGIDWDGQPPWDTGNVYGDPYDIMSSASFGARWLGLVTWNSNPTFSGTPVSWPNANAFQSMGCAPSRANVHFFNEQHFPAAEINEVPLPTGSIAQTVRLYRTTGGNGKVQLLVVRPPNEGVDRMRRTYIEYRDDAGWDTGLDATGSDLARRGVVIHTVAHSGDGPRVWYRGTIFVPQEIDLDFTPPDVPLTVTLMDVGSNRDYVDVRVSAAVQKGMFVDHYETDEEVDVVSEVVKVTVPCGRVHYGTYLLRHRSRFDPFIFGYGNPSSLGTPAAAPMLKWTVGGVAIPPGPSSGSLAIAKEGGGSANVQYDLSVNGSLTVVAKPREGAFRSAVNCTVAEADGSDAISQDLILETLGQYTGVKHLDKFLLHECLRRVLARVRIRKRDMLMPPGPNPYRDRANDRINLARVRGVVDRLRGEQPQMADELRRLSTLLYTNELV